jgi:hypothetical protein
LNRLSFVILEKAIPRAGLVAKKVQVKGKTGAFQAIRWINPNEKQKEDAGDKLKEVKEKKSTNKLQIKVGHVVMINKKLAKISAVGKDGVTAKNASGEKFHILHKDLKASEKEETKKEEKSSIESYSEETKNAQIKSYIDYYDRNDTKELEKYFKSDEGRKIVERTQESIKKESNGKDFIYLYRGINGKHDFEEYKSKNEKLTSWTTDLAIAEQFAGGEFKGGSVKDFGTVIKAKVPIKEIYANDKTFYPLSTGYVTGGQSEYIVREDKFDIKKWDLEDGRDPGEF